MIPENRVVMTETKLSGIPYLALSCQRVWFVLNQAFIHRCTTSLWDDSELESVGQNRIPRILCVCRIHFGSIENACIVYGTESTGVFALADKYVRMLILNKKIFIYWLQSLWILLVGIMELICLARSILGRIVLLHWTLQFINHAKVSAYCFLAPKSGFSYKSGECSDRTEMSFLRSS